MNKILVTGACGFLGSHVCELFKKEGWNVVGYDNLTKFEYNRAFRNVEKIRDYNRRFLEEDLQIPVIIDDIRNLKILTKAARGADLIAHCAAQPAMTIAIEDPLLDQDVNVRGTLNVLQAARTVGAAVVNCSTIHIYGNDINEVLESQDSRFVRPSGPIAETEPILQGTLSPLHASKAAAELYVETYIDTYQLRAANFRLTGIYGPRQFGGEDHGWVANFTIKTLLGQPIKIFGTDKQVRDILYVEDAAAAFFKWHQNGCPDGTFNIGGGPRMTTSIRDLLTMLQSITGKVAPASLQPARHGDLWWFVSNCAEAKAAFGWEAVTTPTQGVWNLAAWIEKERSLFE